MSFATEPVEEATSPNSRPDWLRSKNLNIIARPRTSMAGGYTTSAGSEETMMRTSALPGVDSDYIKNAMWYSGYQDKLAELKIAGPQQSTQNWQAPAAPAPQPMTHAQSVQQPAPTWQGPAKPAAQPMTQGPAVTPQAQAGAQLRNDIRANPPELNMDFTPASAGIRAAKAAPGLLKRFAPGVAGKLDDAGNAIGQAGRRAGQWFGDNVWSRGQSAARKAYQPAVDSANDAHWASSRTADQAEATYNGVLKGLKDPQGNPVRFPELASKTQFPQVVEPLKNLQNAYKAEDAAGRVNYLAGKQLRNAVSSAKPGDYARRTGVAGGAGAAAAGAAYGLSD